ncbi:MurR/RpiR family transcriptional regulator [Oenococcus kitaharae]|uniref:RpiR family Phosphosugar-binding transcriptional regulator n=1 Tax=Oenococcus kitaharae DSM 17330 TaxID=1045004 RepID=G9WHP5_9LACO|nr:MurR/RpiR family transcriptional regulator [Oenococcus kitaharae]EHN58619.1 RpiR family Phosphosugar-binding transcriptional regulator [Oenococcus kitaharae DSM 17330]OEY85504.1 transcriptional regulator [Oenococcus kitaharae]
MQANQDFNFTATETNIYDFLISHKAEVIESNLRDLAKTIHVSPASVLRCIKKMGCDSFYELKFNFRNQQSAQINGQSQKNYLIDIARDFFTRPLLSEYQVTLANIKKMIRQSKTLCFFGVGTSGILAEYGARQFANFGIDAFYNKDPYYPYQRISKDMKSMVLIVLSVSGETGEAIRQITSLKNLKCKIISITNTSYSTIAKLSDINLSYNVSAEVVADTINTTTQIPVLFLLEYLARELKK